MSAPRRFRAFAVAAVAAQALIGGSGGPASADTVVLKNGTIYRGTVDKDNTLVFVNDNLKRIIFYNSKIQKVVSDPGFGNFERFALVQPLEVHTGVQPPAAVAIRATPWDSKGRRAFRYMNARQQTVEMQQAINELGPRLTKFRGIDGFWQGQVATSEVPRPVVTGLLARVDQANEDERLKIARWLLQAGWYPETRGALDGLDRDFPHLKGNVADVRQAVADLEARDVLDDVALRRRAMQPEGVSRLLRGLPTEGLAKDILDEVRAQIKKDDDRGVADRLLADSLRDLAEKLPEGERKAWRSRLAEVLEGLAKAPDAARPRLEAVARAEAAATAEARFALAMTGWIVGNESATDNLKGADDLWRAREILGKYLASRDDSARSSLIGDLEKVRGLDLDAVARVVPRVAPPLRDKDESREKAGEVRIHRVADDENPEPSEYAVLLPPEYHPLRSYPAVVALHDGRGPRSAIDWIAAEASKRGYIVVAPEYNSPGKGKAYRYSSSEQAAAILSLRDARKRYSIDSDRVFLAGQLEGANMAWDFGLGHPDLFAGVVSISGFPARYAYKYKNQVDKLPLYVALGELAPAARELIFDQFVKPMIEDVQDVTYVDYLKRGLEELPEEVPSFFDWMDKRRRDPTPKAFEVATAREGDDRFYGVIIRELAPGRATAPEAADPLGKNLRPATLKMRSSAQANSITLTTSGIARLDVWVSPKLIDFKRKLTIQLNGRPFYSGLVKQDFAPMLEDLRIRGDRQQLYYFKAMQGQGGSRPKGR